MKIVLKKVVHLTLLISIIHFDSVGLGFMLRLTILNIALIEHNLGHGFCLNVTLFEQNPSPRLYSINVLFDFSR